MSTASILDNNLKDSSWHARYESFHEGFMNSAPSSKNCITKIVYIRKLLAIAVNISRYPSPNILYWIQVSIEGLIQVCIEVK